MAENYRVLRNGNTFDTNDLSNFQLMDGDVVYQYDRNTKKYIKQYVYDSSNANNQQNVASGNTNTSNYNNNYYSSDNKDIVDKGSGLIHGAGEVAGNALKAGASLWNGLVDIANHKANYDPHIRV